MPAPDRPPLDALIYAGLLLSWGGAMLAWEGRLLRDAIASRGWPVARGHITRSEVRHGAGRSGRDVGQYLLTRVEYRYRVGTRWYHVMSACADRADGHHRGWPPPHSWSRRPAARL